MKPLLLAAAIAIFAMQSIQADLPAQPAPTPTVRDRALASRAVTAPPAAAAAIAAGAPLIVVDAARQRLVLWEGNTARLIAPVSTATAGLGPAEGSGRTPTGWHRVAEWIGDGAPAGQVFVSRVATSDVVPPSGWRDDSASDLVLTRILWLEGLEPGVNAGPGIDSHERFIYLHGTSQEHLLGTPASHGCIRLSNRDVITLFNLTRGRETFCLIIDS